MSYSSYNLELLIRDLASVISLLFDASTMGFCLVCSIRRSFASSDAHSPDVHSSKVRSSNVHLSNVPSLNVRLSNFHSWNVFQHVNYSLDLV